MGAFLSKVIAGGMLLVVAVTALAYGSVEPWAVALLEGAITLLLLLWMVKCWLDRKLTFAIPSVAFPIAALVAVAVVQGVALTGGDGRRLSMSMDVESTRSAATVLVFLLASSLISVNFLSGPRLSTAVNFVAIWGLVLAGFALVQHYTWDGRFYWLRPNTQNASPFGPFAHHGHYAGYVELLLPIPLAMILTGAARGEMRLLYGFASLVMGVSIIASLSRGGMISLVASLAFVFVAGGLAGRSRFVLHRAALALVIVGALVLSVLWVGSDSVVDRIARGNQSSAGQAEYLASRTWIWGDALSLIGANLLTGVGLGAFETAYHTYSKSNGSLLVDAAHNDYLQIVADCGILGGAIAIWFIIAITRSIIRGARSGSPLLAGWALGGGAAIVAMLVHSLFDFNLQIPSNALLFIVVSSLVSHVGAVVRERELLTTAQASPLPIAEVGG